MLMLILSNWIPKHAGALCSIDGHCEFEGVVRDVRCVSPMLKRGGEGTREGRGSGLALREPLE